MGRQTWKHVTETRPFREPGCADIGESVGTRRSSDHTGIRSATHEPDPVMPGKDALVVMALGVVLLVLAGMLAVTAGQATGQLVRTPGTVVRIVQDSDAMRAYRPIVAYLANDGQRREVAGNTASTVPAYDIGENVDVWLDPSHPERPALIDDFTQRWFPVAVSVLLAVASFAIGGLLIVGGRRRRASEPPTRAARKQARSRWNIAIVLIPIAIGTGFIAGAGAAGLRQWQIVHHYARSTGHVVEIATNARSARARTSLYSAIVAFTTDSGRQITFAQGSASSHPGLHEGEAVNVLYDPVTPERAIVDRFWDRWGLAAILFAIGAPFLAAGLLIAATLWPEHPPHEAAP
ncbi:DUF3592 domain-containing protein [Burkholderia lata]|uniref:DUF3592 domain-containing protein n=1 Tax=Burkholderia lata (strain ATCC 17760 / DSM 23089 / LMG 22485 / NCIMB 9086 / R18194 / 383) TaxID=482957 RepID=UPI0015815228|nr:DUF3592 domain-containing protein [Burkholderia lata]